jgi:hypothetical protein
LDYAAEINKLEQDSMAHQFAEINGDIKAITKDLVNVEVITASNWSDIAKLQSIK